MANLKRKERLKLGLLKLGEIAKLAGVLPWTIRYYANLGLLDVFDRTEGKYRLFNKDETLLRLSRIKEFKDKGLTLEEIRKKLELPQSQTSANGNGEEQL